MHNEAPEQLPQIAFQKATLLLAEKRTAMTTLRTGIAISLIPVSVLSFLSALLEKLEMQANLIPLVFTLAGNLTLTGVGLYLIRRGFVRMRFHNRMLEELQAEYPALKQLFYPG